MSTDALTCFAIAPPGLEAVVAGELRGLGAVPVVTQGGVEFEADTRLLYDANLRLRVASRVLVRSARFRARTFFELERHAKKIPWATYLEAGGSVALRVTSRKSKLYHEGAIAERLMSAISANVGAVRQHNAGDDETGDAADAQLFVVRFVRDECVVSADSSGALLHRRGYRQALAKAPLRENIAAALLLASGWDGSRPLLDPMCGSGTIPIEAALLARNIPPALANTGHAARAFAFEQWPHHDIVVWKRNVALAREQIRAQPGVRIVGSDRDAGAITAATANAVRAGVADNTEFAQRPVSAADVASMDTWVVSNPPYGVRVGGGDTRDLYAALGRLAREKAPAGRVVLLTPEAGAGTYAGLPLQTLAETRNGGIVVRIAG